MIEVKPLAMKEAQTFWGDKLQLSPSEFGQLSDDAKVKAFAISGLARGDELETAFNSLQRSLDKGTTFQDFKKDCAEIFENRGWGNRRIEAIFRTNIQTAYSVGRYEQMKRVTTSRPYWQYDAVGDKRTRPTHAALDGKVFKADHPFWDTWYPTNGFNCRCSVSSLSERQVKARGLKVESDDPTNTLIEPVDPQTGAKLPARQLIPDKGFDHHPGKSVYGGLTPRENAHGLVDMGLKGHEDYGRAKMGNLPRKAYRAFSEDDLLESGKDPEFYVKEFLQVLGLEDTGEGVFSDKTGSPLIISENLFRTREGAWKVKKQGRERFLKLLAETIKNPYEIWLTPMKEEKTGRIVLRRRFLRGFSTGPDHKLGGFTVFEYGRDGWKGTTAFQPKTLNYVDKVRNGVLLWKEK